MLKMSNIKRGFTFDEYEKSIKNRYNASLIFKITNYCPHNCSYCYHKYKNEEDLDKEMSLDVFKEALYKLGDSFEVIKLHLHGGEPLTVPYEKLKSMLEIIEEYRQKRNRGKFIITMATNLLLLDEEKLEILEEHDVKISTSYDGKYHNEKRAVNLERVKEKIDMTQGVGMIGVMTKDWVEDLDESIDYVENSKKGKPLVNPVMAFPADDEDVLDPGDYSDFVIRRFEKQMETGLFSWGTLRYLQAVLGHSGDCFVSGCLNSIFTVTPSGNIKGCDSRNEDYWYYCNISDIECVEDIYETEKYKNMQRMYYNRLKKCEKECDVFEYCVGGCPNNYRLRPDGEFSKDYMCYDYKQMIYYFRDFYESFGSKEENLPERIKDVLMLKND
jgi:radical SAM protein with 4Fe4S-binding SPASM domain